MKHESFRSRMRNLDVEIHFIKIDHTKQELRVILLDVCFGKYPKEG